jgi:hypothetical protein
LGTQGPFDARLEIDCAFHGCCVEQTAQSLPAGAPVSLMRKYVPKRRLYKAFVATPGPRRTPGRHHIGAGAGAAGASRFDDDDESSTVQATSPLLSLRELTLDLSPLVPTKTLDVGRRRVGNVCWDREWCWLRRWRSNECDRGGLRLNRR